MPPTKVTKRIVMRLFFGQINLVSTASQRPLHAKSLTNPWTLSVRILLSKTRAPSTPVLLALSTLSLLSSQYPDFTKRNSFLLHAHINSSCSMLLRKGIQLISSASSFVNKEVSMCLSHSLPCVHPQFVEAHLKLLLVGDGGIFVLRCMAKYY